MPDGNHLYYGDNLDVLGQHVPSESVDLIYLDPPFNSNRSYNVLFRSPTGTEAQAQIEAFDDSWHWTQQTQGVYDKLVGGGAPIKVAEAIEAMRKLLGPNDMTAYLVMMTPRLVELHRVLKTTGSLYLHCDPTASHYLKLILDAVFGPEHFKNEIIWRRTGSHGKVKRFGPIHDSIFFYTKTETFTWNAPTKRFMRGHVAEYFVEDESGWRTNYYGNVLTGSGTRGGESGQVWKGFDPTSKGRHWAIPGALVDEVPEDMSSLTQHQKLDRLFDLGYIRIEPGQAWPMYQHYITPEDGTPAPDIWAYQPYTEGTVFDTNDGIDADVRWLSTRDAERLGYPTQKPIALLERIISASSNEGDVVLDPFCGCGTAVDAAQKLRRQWIGIDITYLAVDLIRKRLLHSYGPSMENQYLVSGIPTDVEGAEALFNENPFDFERWAVSLVNGEPNQKQVGDKGIDGRIRFQAAKSAHGMVIVSVKGGKQINPSMVRDLVGTVQRQNAEMGLLLTLTKPTRGMIDEANHSGNYLNDFTGNTFPKIQIFTIEDLMSGKKPSMLTPILPYVKAKPRAPQVNPLF